jgi:hypothetical protein
LFKNRTIVQFYQNCKIELLIYKRIIRHLLNQELTKGKMATPFCAHCNNLKLPANHWLRDRSGQLLCPILQKTECRYCFKMGHTVSRCPAKNSAGERKPAELKEASAKPVVAKTITNRFSAFDDDSDDDEDTGRKVGQKTKRAKVESIPMESSKPYAAALLSQAPVSKPAQALSFAKETDRTYMTRPVITVEQSSFVNCAMFSSINKQKNVRSLNWADWSDDEDEDSNN